MIHPYIGGGAGWSWGKFDGAYSPVPSMDESDSAFAWQGLAGINLEITENLSADFAYRYLESEYSFNDLDAKSRDHTILVGLNYHFGAAKPVAAVVEEKDSDGDGVFDSRDKCPDTPKGCVVDEDGCPIDSDNDGVCDGRDQCPDTPEGCEVDENGCPIDSDKDGIIDCMDKCPGTPENAKVDENGCPYFVSIRLGVEFDFDKAVVKPQYMEDIKKVGDFMKAHPNLNATIEGHTDSMGTAQYNLKLSEKRAEAVKKILIEQENIDPERITTVGYGLTKPIASNDTEEGRQLNRRVQAVLETQALKN
jgi:OOP family OmpA-OmpF porin